MNRNTCIKQLCRASAAIVIAMALLAFALLPQTARADWRSLSGGFLPAFASEPSFVISPDSRMVAFVTDKDTDDIHELYAMPITGTAPIKLNPPLVSGGDVNTGRFQFTPDGQYVIYLADQEVDNRAELFRVPVGGQAAKLNPFLTTEGNSGSCFKQMSMAGMTCA
jgi:Tol biopolymer transport system component